MVGAGRFERPTPCAQGRCATRLRYAPTSYFSDSKTLFRRTQRSASPVHPSAVTPSLPGSSPPDILKSQMVVLWKEQSCRNCRLVSLYSQSRLQFSDAQTEFEQGTI